MIIAFLILVIYLSIKFLYTQQLDSLGAYAGYVFEFLFVIIVGFYYRKRLNFKCDLSKELKVSFLPALVAGCLVFLLANPLQIPIPFDLNSGETILFLLFVGPILEEFIFRMALWHPIADISKKWNVQGASAALVVTSLLFSYAHFHSYWFVPEQFYPFIYYQTAYVIPLAFYCGYRMLKTGSLVSPIAVHMGFNLGFFIGSQL